MIRRLGREHEYHSKKQEAINCGMNISRVISLMKAFGCDGFRAENADSWQWEWLDIVPSTGNTGGVMYHRQPG